MTDTYYYSPETLEKIGFEMFKASGSPEEEARLISTRLVASNLAGHDSHGVLRLHTYMGWLRKGMIKPGATPAILKDNGATAVVDGHWGYGQVAAEYTMALAIERAHEHGVAAVGVTQLLHVGRLADYAITAAKAGMIALVSTSAGGFAARVAPFGGLAGRIATNPFAVGFPSSEREPVFFDFATATVAEGKLQVARDAGLDVAEGLILDKEGNPTTNPVDFYEGGAILPVGGPKGYKGYLMAFLVEVLAGLLTGGGFVGREEDPVFNNCTFMIVIDVEVFRNLGDFKGEMERLIDHLKATPAHPGDEVLYPGEVEVRNEAQRRRDGIPLAAETVRKIQEELDNLKVPLQMEGLAQNPPLPAP